MPFIEPLNAHIAPAVLVNPTTGHGDGYAAVGYIEATSDLGAISIDGDLGGVSAGVTPSGAKPPPSVISLSVLSMGEYGVTTQPASSGAFTPTLASTILGELGSLSVTSDIAAGVGPGPNGYGQDAVVLAHVTTGIYSAIASVTIGGQAIGTFNGDTTGTVYGIVAQEIGSVKIGSAAIALMPGPGNQTTPIPLGITGDLNLYDLAT